jgi:hypothetical protein
MKRIQPIFGIKLSFVEYDGIIRIRLLEMSMTHVHLILIKNPIKCPEILYKWAYNI